MSRAHSTEKVGPSCASQPRSSTFASVAASGCLLLLSERAGVRILSLTPSGDRQCSRLACAPRGVEICLAQAMTITSHPAQRRFLRHLAAQAKQFDKRQPQQTGSSSAEAAQAAHPSRLAAPRHPHTPSVPDTSGEVDHSPCITPPHQPPCSGPSEQALCCTFTPAAMRRQQSPAGSRPGSGL